METGEQVSRPRIKLPDITSSRCRKRESSISPHRSNEKWARKSKIKLSSASCSSRTPSPRRKRKRLPNKNWDSSEGELSTDSRDRFGRYRTYPKESANKTSTPIRETKKPKGYMRQRATLIGWNTSDDESLKPHKRHSNDERNDKKVQRRSLRPQSLSINSLNIRHEQNRHLRFNDLFSGLELTLDAAQETMRLRKRAFVLGKFRFILASGNESGKELESSLEFQKAIKNSRCSSGITFVARPPGYKGRLPILTGSRYAELQFTKQVESKTNRIRKYNKKKRHDLSGSQVDLSDEDDFGTFPGSGKRHHVAWSTPLGDVRIDAMVKLYDLLSIQAHHVECDNRGPKSPWFGLVDPRLTDTFDGKVHFDANMFWTVGLLFKHFGTCGMESWDNEMAEMANTHICAEEASRRDGQVALFKSRYQTNQEKELSYVNTEQNHLVQSPPIPVGSHDAPYTNVAYDSTLMEHSYFQATVPASQSNVLVSISTADNSLQETRYTGCIMEWRGHYGFISCMKISSKVMLPANEIQSLSGSWQPGSDLPVGTSVNFALYYDQIKGYKAMNAKLYI